MCFRKSISQRQRKYLATQSLVFSLFSARQTFSLLENKKTLADLKIQFLQGDYLKNAITQNGSALIVTGHLGIFPLIPLYLAKNNYKIDVIIKPPHNMHFQEFIFDYMRKNDIGIIPATPENAYYGLICSSLRNNRMVMVMIDQTPTRHQSQTTVKFFDWNTLVYPTITKLSQKFEVPIIPLFTYYDTQAKGSPYIIKAYKPLYPSANANPVLEVNNILEELILHYPWQWWWFHKKWYNLLDYNNHYFYNYARREPDKFFAYLLENEA